MTEDTLTIEQQAALRRLCAAIIPASAPFKVPGADDEIDVDGTDDDDPPAHPTSLASWTLGGDAARLLAGDELPAVDPDHVPGHEVEALGGECDDRVGDVLRRTTDGSDD